MAQNEFKIYTDVSNWKPQGEEQRHDEFPESLRLSSPTGGELCRKWEYISSVYLKNYKCTGATGSISDVGQYPTTLLDGTRAISLRARVKMGHIESGPIPIRYRSFAFITAKAKSYHPSGAETPYSAIGGYGHGIMGNYYYHTYRQYRRVYIQRVKYYGSNSVISNLEYAPYGTVSSDEWLWHHIRMDVEPIVGGDGEVTADKLVYYHKYEHDTEWGKDGEVYITTSGFIPWNDPEKYEIGFSIGNAYIDDFKLFVSTGYE